MKSKLSLLLLLASSANVLAADKQTCNVGIAPYSLDGCVTGIQQGPGGWQYKIEEAYFVVRNDKSFSTVECLVNQDTLSRECRINIDGTKLNVYVSDVLKYPFISDDDNESESISLKIGSDLVSIPSGESIELIFSDAQDEKILRGLLSSSSGSVSISKKDKKPSENAKFDLKTYPAAFELARKYISLNDDYMALFGPTNISFVIEPVRVVSVGSSSILEPAKLKAVSEYQTAIQKAVSKAWTERETTLLTGAKAKFRLGLTKSGATENVTIEESSGDNTFDQAALAAISKASPYPIPQDKALYEDNFKTLELIFEVKGNDPPTEAEAAAEVESVEAVVNNRITERAAIVGEYQRAIQRTLKSNWRRPTSVSGKLETVMRITMSPGGEVKSVVVTRSSGNDDFDESAKRAVQNASPLPVPADAQIFRENFKVVNLKFKPED